MIHVVICTHNGVQFLEAQLVSIMDQNRPVDVVHLFDFASTDGTRAMLENMSLRWPKLDVQLVDQAPGVTLSFFHAFAQVAQKCGADDVIFLSDQDDIWLPEKTERMLDRMALARIEGGDRILVFHDVQICDEALHPLRQSFYEGRPFRLPRDIERESLLITNPVIGHTIAITKPLLDLALRCLRPSCYVMHDWALVLLATYAGRTIFLPERLGLYRQHGANVLGAGRRRSVGEYVRRAFRLSRSINEQALAFAQDYRCAVQTAGIVNPPSVLPGRGSLEWRLGIVMARRGPTVWHRLGAIVQVRHLLRRDIGEANE